VDGKHISDILREKGQKKSPWGEGKVKKKRKGEDVGAKPLR